MSWIDPVINRTNTARLKPEDLNRISGNINYLIGTSLTTSWAADDFLDVQSFNDILDGTKTAALKYGVMIYEAPDLAQTFENYNNIENLLLQCKTALDLWQLQAAAQKYLNQGLYLSSDYLNYVRGF